MDCSPSEPKRIKLTGRATVCPAGGGGPLKSAPIAVVGAAQMAFQNKAVAKLIDLGQTKLSAPARYLRSTCSEVGWIQTELSRVAPKYNCRTRS